MKKLINKLFRFIFSKNTKILFNSDSVRMELYKILTNFFEKENGKDAMPWLDDELHKQVIGELEKIYNWIKNERPLLVSKIVSLWCLFPAIKAQKEKDTLIQQINDLEHKLVDYDSRNLKKIIEYREFLDIIK